MNARTTRAGFFLCGCAAFVNLYSTQGILTQIAGTFEVSPEEAGLSVSAATLAVAVAAPFVGIITDKFDRRKVISCAALAIALPTLLSAHASSFAAFLLARFAAGLAMPFVFATSIAYIGELFAGGAIAEMSALFVAGTTLGGFAGRFATNLVTSFSTWRHGLDVLAFVCFALGCGVSVCLPQAPAERAKPAYTPSQQKARAWLKNRPLVAAFVVGSCILFSQVATFTFIGLHLEAPPYRLGTAAIGSLYAVFLLAVVVTPLSARFLKHRDPADIVLVAAAIGICGIALTVSRPLPLVVAGLALSSTGVFVAQAAASAFVTRLAPPGSKSTAVGLYLSFYYLGGSLGTIVPVPAWRAFGWAGCAAAVICVQILAAVLARRHWITARTLDQIDRRARSASASR